MNKSVFHAAVAAFVDMWAAQVNFLQLIFPNVPESIITAQTWPDTIPPHPHPHLHAHRPLLLFISPHLQKIQA